MKHERLDGVLARNRQHVVRDLVLAALFPLALLLSGYGIGSQLKLGAAPAPVVQVSPIEVG
jgi:hypothetical protein